jgi:hypothetical protein
MYNLYKATEWKYSSDYVSLLEGHLVFKSSCVKHTFFSDVFQVENSAMAGLT